MTLIPPASLDLRLLPCVSYRHRRRLLLARSCLPALAALHLPHGFVERRLAEAQPGIFAGVTGGLGSLPIRAVRVVQDGGAHG